MNRLYYFKACFLPIEFELEKSNRAWSKSKTGPVTPVIIKGQPANKAQRIPETDETIIVSVIPIRFEVVSPRIPPKAGMNKQINKLINWN